MTREITMTPKKHAAALAVVGACALLSSPTAFAQQQGQQGGKTSAQVEQVLQSWEEHPRKVAQDMMEKYGPPHEVTDQRLIWHKTGPWKRTELINETIDHRFPLPHKDMLLQVVDFQVPADKFDDIAEFDGSVIVERTRGELGARCDKERANFLAVNLAQDIATGKRSTEEARKLYTEQIIALANGQPAPLTQTLNFQPMRNAGDPDRMTMDEATAQSVKQKMKAMDKKKQ
jgi:hypothetical protein